jgi:hypothetical protein
MPNKPVRQNAKYREQQLRKRAAAAPRGGTAPAELSTPETDTIRLDNPPGNGTSTVRFAPGANGTATATRPAPAAPRRPAAMAVPSAVRTARGRIATQMQQMNLEDEMAFVRSDIRRLLILAAASFAILIILAFVIH